MISSLMKAKKYQPLQNGGPSPLASNAISTKNKRKKKRKKNSPYVEPLTSFTAISKVEEFASQKPKFTVKRKKLKCDKLLLNMMKKKRKLKSAVTVGPTTEEDCGNSDIEEVVVVGKSSNLLKKKLNKFMAKGGIKTKEGEETVPLLSQTPKSKFNKVNKDFSDNTRNGISIPVLPITECREAFIQRFKEHDTLIVVGETGCGKSTQIPKFLMQECPQLFSFRGMAITQPRRVAAISLANRVSYELGTDLGQLVGFKVRFDKQVSENTKITFLTDGYLMMDAIRDKCFNDYSVIIVDEAHERSVETDVVLSLLKNAQIIRKSRAPKKRLKLIIMSATLDVDKFQSFFNLKNSSLSTKAVYVKGRPFSLQLNYLPKDIQENHIDLTWITLLKLHMDMPISHHILVFLTGKEEIDLICARATSINQKKDLGRVFVCPLYAALSKETQMKSFELPAENTRKIVVSTNLAETSLTIPGIRLVIDSGRVKSKYFDEALGMNVLRVQLISKSQADQRAGRAGREIEGSVYRLYTKSDYEKMEEFPLPEITRSNLSRVLLLAAVSLGVDNFKEFPLPDNPSKKAIRYAMNELHRYGAIETNQQPVKLTRTAKRLLTFPVELHLAKVLYLAVQYQELSRICAIVAMSTVETVYSPDYDEEAIRHNRHQVLWAPEGDYVTFWKIFKEFKKSKSKKSWCREHGLQFRTLLYVSQVWKHLLTVCQNMELESDERLSCGDAVDFKEKVQLIFQTAFSHQIAKLSKTGAFYIVENQFDSSIKFHAKIHPGSSLVARKPGRLMFTHLSFNEVDNTVYMHNCGVL